MNERPVYAGLVLAKCAAGFAALVLIALIGFDKAVDTVMPATMPATVVAGEATRQTTRSLLHRKQVFYGWRARFHEGGGHGAANKDLEPANRLPFALR